MSDILLLVLILSVVGMVAIPIAKLFRIPRKEFCVKSEDDFMKTKNYQVFKMIEKDLIENRNHYTSLWSFDGGMKNSVQRKVHCGGYLTILIMKDGSIISPVDMTNQPRKYKDIIKKHVDEIYRADLNEVIKKLQS